MFKCLVCSRQPHRQTEHRHCNVGHFQGHSTDDCRVEFRSEHKETRSYFCTVHQQWVSEFAIKTHYTFEHEQEEGTKPSLIKGETDAQRKARYRKEKKDPYSPAVRKVMNSGD